MKYAATTLFLVLLGCAGAAAQRSMSADECMAYAVTHNRNVRKATLSLDSYQANRFEAIGSFLPYVSASGSAQYNFGRGIDPETNTYTNVTTFSNGFGVSASLPVFNGLARIHTLRAARVDVLMGKSALSRQEDEVALATLQAYVDVLYYKGTVAMAEEKQKEGELLLRQTRLLEEVGRKTPGDVAQMEAQAAETEVEVVRQRNRMETALMRLKETMNWPAEEELLTEDIVADFPAETAEKREFLSEERQAYYQMETARLGLRRAKASLWPSISLSGGWSTSFYKTLDVPSQTNWGNQMRNHRGEWVAANISFPLFGRFGTMMGIRRARNNYRYACENYEQKRSELELLRRETVMDAEAYRRETEGMMRKVAADSMAYALVRLQWAEGLSTAIDVTVTSANLLNSRARLLQARLLAEVKRRLALYYNGVAMVPQHTKTKEERTWTER
ncbi:MAG: TolC family protein [Bacteroidaceae bacterium]|nr:TolC family protein [Bacteroidaceae bacterium]